MLKPRVGVTGLEQAAEVFRLGLIGYGGVVLVALLSAFTGALSG